MKKNSLYSLEQVFGYLTSFIRGWLGYFGLADMREFITKLNAHIRRMARAKMLKQWKRTYRRGINIRNIHRHTMKYGTRIRWKPMWCTIKYDGIWCMSNHWTITNALHNEYLESIGCPYMLTMYEGDSLQIAEPP
jgi:hypothetical protein